MESIISNIVIIVVVLCIVGAISVYLYKAKKKGQTCIGCPYAKECSGKCGGHHNIEQNESKK